MCPGRVGEYRSCAKSSGREVSLVALVLLVVCGDPSVFLFTPHFLRFPGWEDGFPIKNVGNDGESSLMDSGERPGGMTGRS
jgi:hypothetical protein